MASAREGARAQGLVVPSNLNTDVLYTESLEFEETVEGNGDALTTYKEVFQVKVQSNRFHVPETENSLIGYGLPTIRQFFIL